MLTIVSCREKRKCKNCQAVFEITLVSQRTNQTMGDSLLGFGNPHCPPDAEVADAASGMNDSDSTRQDVVDELGTGVNGWLDDDEDAGMIGEGVPRSRPKEVYEYQVDIPLVIEIDHEQKTNFVSASVSRDRLQSACSKRCGKAVSVDKMPVRKVGVRVHNNTHRHLAVGSNFGDASLAHDAGMEHADISWSVFAHPGKTEGDLYRFDPRKRQHEDLPPEDAPTHHTKESLSNHVISQREANITVATSSPVVQSLYNSGALDPREMQIAQVAYDRNTVDDVRVPIGVYADEHDRLISESEMNRSKYKDMSNMRVFVSTADGMPFATVPKSVSHAVKYDKKNGGDGKAILAEYLSKPQEVVVIMTLAFGVRDGADDLAGPSA